MTTTTPFRLDKTWLYGILLLVVSLLVFILPFFYHIDEDANPLFIINYFIALFYFGVICFNHRLSIHEQNGLPPLLVFAVISLVSCYALNRNLEVIRNDIPGWPALLVILAVNYLSAPFYFYLPRLLQVISCTIAGVGLIAFLYLSIHLLPVYLLGGLGILTFGLGLHVFVPLLFVAYTIVFIRQVGAAKRQSYYAFGTGALIALIAFLQIIDWNTLFTL